MTRKKLTTRTVNALTSDDPRGTRCTDTELAGFEIAVYPTGRKVFSVRYGDRRRRRRVTLGAYGVLTVDEARAMAKQTLAGYARGEDPARERARRKSMPTLAEWVDSVP